MLKQHGHRLDPGAVPGGSTINTLEKTLVKYLVYDRKKQQILLITRNKKSAELYQCVYDGAELGSTDMKVEWSLPDDCVIGQEN